MKVEAIVFESNTGFTKRYAELLSEATGLKAYERKSAGTYLKKGTAVLYMGWLMAGSVKGFRKARGRYRVRALAAVGMGSPSDKSSTDTVLKYQTAEMPAFYLHGGMDVSRLKGMYRFMMNNVAKAQENPKAAPAGETDDARRVRELVTHGGDFVKKENLEQIMAWIK